MKDNVFSIGDYYDLLNLHKALLESRFHQGLDNKYLAGSPVIARIHSQIMDKLAIWEIERKGSEGWTEWRKISNRKDYLEIAVNNIIKFEEWDCSSHIETIKNYISPFTATEEEIKFIEECIEKKINKVDTNHSFENGVSLKGYYLNMIDEFYDLIMSEDGFLENIRCDRIFDEKKYDRIKKLFKMLIAEWKEMDNISKKALLAIVEFMICLSSGNDFMSVEENERMENAYIEIYDLFCDLY